MAEEGANEGEGNTSNGVELTRKEVSKRLDISLNKLVIPENLIGKPIDKETFYQFVEEAGGTIPNPPAEETIEKAHRRLEKKLESYPLLKGKDLRNASFYEEYVGEDKLTHAKLSFMVRQVGKGSSRTFYFVHKGNDVFERITSERYNEIKKQKTIIILKQE